MTPPECDDVGPHDAAGSATPARRAFWRLPQRPHAHMHAILRPSAELLCAPPPPTALTPLWAHWHCSGWCRDVGAGERSPLALGSGRSARLLVLGALPPSPPTHPAGLDSHHCCSPAHQARTQPAAACQAAGTRCCTLLLWPQRPVTASCRVAELGSKTRARARQSYVLTAMYRTLRHTTRFAPSSGDPGPTSLSLGLPAAAAWAYSSAM